MSFPYRALFSLSLSLALLCGIPTFLFPQQSDDLRPNPDQELERIEEQLKESLKVAKDGQEGEDPSGRHEWFLFQRRFPYSTIPAEMRTKAIRETKAMVERLAQSVVREKGASVQTDAAEWVNIGPRNIAGRVRAIAMHPSNEGTFFIGAASGGVWQNTGNYNQWTTTFDGQSALAIGAIEFDPSNPDIVYVGTGEVINSHTSQFNATPAYFGDGIFKSTDGGQTWFPLGLSQLGTISDIYVRRDNPNMIFATSAQGGGGFYRSTDGGGNWVQLHEGIFFGMAVNSKNEDEMLIAEVSTFAGSGRVVIVTNASGATPEFASAVGISPSRTTRVSIARSLSNPNIVYALAAQRNETANSGRDSGLVYKSVDGGENWTLKSRFGGAFFNAQGHYNNYIAVHPSNSSIALLCGIDVYRTANGGDTWTNTTRSLLLGNVHPDQHVALFDPFDNDVVYLGNDGGVYRSSNTGLTWTRISLSLPITQFYELGLDQTRPYRVYGGTQDNGSMGAFSPNEWADKWTPILGGDGFHAIVDESDPNTIYAESQYGVLSRINATTLRRTYLTRNLDRHSSSDYDPGAWSTPIAMSPADKLSLYTGRAALWRSTDRGSSWQALQPGNSARISAIGLSSFDHLDMVIGTAGGEVFSSTDGGFGWERASGIPRRYISEIIFDPVVNSRVYITASGFRSGHVFRSDDFGRTFVDITNNLPDIPTSSIAVDPENNNTLFVGNDVGVFISLDGGELWLPFNNKLPFVPVVDLEIHRSRRTLVAATHGRSMFEISIVDPQLQPTIIRPSGGQNFVSDDTLNIVWTGIEEPVRVMISYDGGRTFDTIAIVNDGSTLWYIIPFVRSTNTIVHIETLDRRIIVDSDPFSVSPKINTDSRGTRGFLAGAIAIRGGSLWAVNRENDNIEVLRLPMLFPITKSVTRTGIPGDVIDLAYDEANDRFFVLTGNTSDFSGAKLYAMDTTGASTGEVPLPESTIGGVAMTPQGLTVMTAGTDGRAYVIDPDDGSVISSTDRLVNGTGDRRTGLDWDGSRLVQGVKNAQPNTSFPDALHRLRFEEQLAVRHEIPLVVQNNRSIDLYGLAFFPDEDPTNGRYYLTDTDGEFYILKTLITTGVQDRRFLEVSSSVTLRQISPNPFRSVAELEVEINSAGNVWIDVFDEEGRNIATPFDGRMEPGMHSIRFNADNLPSGVYTFVLTGSNGDRDIRPAILLR